MIKDAGKDSERNVKPGSIESECAKLDNIEPGSIEVMEYKPQDRTEVVDQDPSYRYYWESRKKLQDNGGNPDRGYEVVHGNMSGGVDAVSRKEVDELAPRGESGNYEGTERTIGDLVLIRCHENFYASRKDHHKRENESRIRAARDVSGAEHFDPIRDQKISGRRVMIQGGITR